MIKLYLLVLLALGYCEAGQISDSFLASFTNQNDRKDAIVEYSSVFDKVLSDSSLNSLSRDDRRNKIVSLTKQYTAASQLPVLNALTTLGLRDQSTPFWAANKISVRNVPLSALQSLAAIPGPFTIREAKTVKLFPFIESKPVSSDYNAALNISKRQSNESNAVAPQWGVAKINAPVAHANGINGTGILVGIIDTGVSPTHEALRSNYNNDEGSWHDAVNNKTEPYDDQGHGTHCMGTIAGTTNGIGVAPGAKWMACKALDKNGGGSEESLTTCGEFMACPNNSTGKCTGFPDVVSNSWGGGCDDDFYNHIIELWRLVGIIPVFAIGNSGPKCGSANSPGDQPNLISVGSTDPNDKVSDFSSRGPGGPLDQRILGFWIGSDKLTVKPEVSAPGRNITSADARNDTAYVGMSGTSMATPHVVGAIALQLSSNQTLNSSNNTMKFEEVRSTLETTAVKYNATRKCPSWKPATQPNNDYGHGRIDVKKALGI